MDQHIPRSGLQRIQLFGKLFAIFH